jgi:ubiquinone/menaquinone biosynthesis C-methylase UbiE
MKPSAERYYDEFSRDYEAHRHYGYHRMLDDLEVELALRYSSGPVLEAGCGTGLLLERIAAERRGSRGFDLSRGMLSHALRRQLQVAQADATALPFPDGAFDAVVSFKVLAHVPPIERALQELARVTRPGGHLVLEFYNRHSLRYLLKQAKRPSQIGSRFTDDDVYTRYDTLEDVQRYLPANTVFEAVHGVRVLTPMAQAHDLPVVGGLLSRAERVARDAWGLRRLGGFMVVVARKATD